VDSDLDEGDPMSRATYLYCLVRAAAAPPLAEVPSGVPGAGPVRLLPVDDGLWLAATDVPLPDYGSEEIRRGLQDLSWVSERALPHEAVVEHFTRAGAVVPLKLFTLFTSDERALAHMRGDRGRLDRTLDRIAGRAEWGVRIRFDESRAKEVVAAETRAVGGDGKSAGTNFLLRKKLEQEASRTLAARLRTEADEAFAELSAEAAEAVRREAPTPEAGARLLLDAAFLVPESHTAEFEGAVARCAERLTARACEVTLTGPWPPYHFIEEVP
jgi:hypothetical protein